MSAPASSLSSLFPSRLRPKTNLPRPVSAAWPLPHRGTSVGVRDLYQSCLQPHARGSSFNKKGIPVGDTVRQVDHQMMRDCHVRMSGYTSEGDMAGPTKCEYSDAGVAKLMEQYTSLFKELGIHESIPPRPGISNTRVNRVGTRNPTRHLGSQHKPINQDAGHTEGNLIGRRLGTQVGQLKPAAMQFGLSSILSSAENNRYIQQQRSSSASCTEPLGIRASDFGLSTVLGATRSSSGNAPVWSETAELICKQSL